MSEDDERSLNAVREREDLLYENSMLDLQKKEYIGDLEKDEEEQKKIQKEQQRGEESKNRDEEFRKLMEGHVHVAGGILTAKTHWRDYDYCMQVKDLPAYKAVAANANTSGSTPKDLFEDVTEELEKQEQCAIMVRFKNRYMIMEIFLDANEDAAVDDQKEILSSNNVTKAIKDSILLNFGEVGLAISLGSFQLKYLNATTKICIIRTSRDDHQKVWCAITLVRSVGNCPATFNLLKTSGNIRACKRAALKCEEARLSQYCMLAAGEAALPDISKLRKEFTEKINSLES